MADLWNDWVFNQDEKIEESNAVSLLREQARLVNQKSNGLVKASFTKIGNVKLPEGITTFIEGTTKIISAVKKTEDHLQNLEDLSKEYEAVAYKFELYTDTYRFRIFELIDRKLFPVTLILDEDIADQICRPSPLNIENNKELEKLLTIVLGSKKVKSVIGRMMEGKSK